MYCKCKNSWNDCIKPRLFLYFFVFKKKYIVKFIQTVYAIMIIQENCFSFYINPILFSMMSLSTCFLEYKNLKKWYVQEEHCANSPRHNFCINCCLCVYGDSYMCFSILTPAYFGWPVENLSLYSLTPWFASLSFIFHIMQNWAAAFIIKNLEQLLSQSAALNLWVLVL